ncbi:MAG TPA: hypothetical protein VK988_16825 [Acidimicrobiales bacterium]|nr:hypothetical protein [Acidimicrobiales bacterium]
MPVLAIASPAEAATYRIGGVRYDTNCGGSTSSMVSNFVANADYDGSNKVDFLDLKQSGRIYLPSSCPTATKICLSGRIIANSTRGFVSTAPFGAWNEGLWDNSHVVESGYMAAAYGSKCMSINARSATITAYPDDNLDSLIFIWPGSYSKLTDYKIELRVRWYANGTWRTGNWASYSKTM